MKKKETKKKKQWWREKIVINGITVWSGKKPKKLNGLDSFLKS